MFSGRYCNTLEKIKKETFYNKITQKPYSVKGYLEGVIVKNSDYKSVFEKYKSSSLGGVGGGFIFDSRSAVFIDRHFNLQIR